MGKWVAPGVLDGALREIAAATRMVALDGQPADFAAALAGRLAEAPLSAADFVMGAGQGAGRKVTIGAKAGIPVMADGVARHVALIDTAASRLLYVTTCPDQALAAGGEVNFDAWSVEIGAPL